MKRLLTLVFLLLFGGLSLAGGWGTGALMVIVERESGSVLVVDSTRHEVLGRVEGLGLLHHAAISFSRDARYAYVATRDGSLSKVDLLNLRLMKKVRVGESTIGLAVTQDNRYVAISNYKPRDVRVLDAETLEVVKVIPAVRELHGGERQESRTVGLVDAPGNLLIFSLMDADGIWVIDAKGPNFPVIRRFWDVGKMPYDGILTPDGRHYLAGLYHSNGIALLDTWDLNEVKTVSFQDPTQEHTKVPVLKISHLGGLAITRDLLFLPVVGEARLAVYNTRNWKLVKSIPLLASPVFAIVRPDGRQVWVNFALGERNNVVQVIDVQKLEVVRTLEPGRRIFHLQFTPKGEAIYLSANLDDRVVIYDTATFKPIKEVQVRRPSGIFSTDRAHKFGL